MGDPQAGSRSLQIPEELPDRVLTPEQKRELAIDTMASWALDGIYPTRETVESINEFLASGLTADQHIEQLKEKWRQAEGGQLFVDSTLARLGRRGAHRLWPGLRRHRHHRQ